jgi:hypothetical protein
VGEGVMVRDHAVSKLKTFLHRSGSVVTPT